MLLKRFYDTKLAQASYLVGCQRTGEALVIDANRDVDQYVRGAEAEGLRIAHVTETHIHADFVSGSRELAERTGGQLYLSDEGDADWKYAYARLAGAQLLRDGDVISVGNVTLRVLHSPGHTPEHVSFLLTDRAASDRPMGVFTGDFVFVGDVGRPDLLERAANVRGTMERSARTLFGSLQEFKALPDYVQVWPGHGAGSACGKALGAVPQSTVGYEKLVNWALQAPNEDEFIAGVLSGQPEPPKYFAEMKRINKEGPRVLHGIPRPERLPVARLREKMTEGALVVDTRHAADFAEGHVPGTINIPLNRSFTTWAGWLVPYDTDFHLIVDEDLVPQAIDEAARDLSMIGLDRVAGYFGSEVISGWAAEGGTLETIEHITPRELAARQRRGDVAVIDVRGASEWEEGHIPGVPNIPVGMLPDRLDEVPRDKPVAVHCQSGARSAIAASVLQASGVKNVMNVAGGFAEWSAGGLAVEKE
ncbi:MAG TPA: rhodanese-like domain-containing protein [Gemmatimonadaceae bacterium]|nr:rhodanese-like domain-containing protein [Gemmatimonadaceae bacterium]